MVVVNSVAGARPVRVLFLCRKGHSSESAWRSFSDFVRAKRIEGVSADCVNFRLGMELAVSKVIECDHVVVPINVLKDAERILQGLKHPPALHSFT